MNKKNRLRPTSLMIKVFQWKGICKKRLSDSPQWLQTRQQPEGNAPDLVIPCYGEATIRKDVWLCERLLLLRYGDVDQNRLREGLRSGLHHAVYSSHEWSFVKRQRIGQLPVLCNGGA